MSVKGGDMRSTLTSAERSGFRYGLALGVCIGIATLGLLVMASSCELPTEPGEPRDGCRNESEFCAGKVVAPLNPDEVYLLQVKVNAWLDTQGVKGKHVFPRVEWHPCFFTVPDGQCAAGWTKDATEIHVSTAEPGRTEPLVMHETTHARYCSLGNCDAAHRLAYNW